MPNQGESQRVLIGVMGLVFGSVGAHRFILGDATGGLLRILITFMTCGLGSWIGFAEGIIYLSKSDEAFHQIYEVEKKAWF